VAYPNAIIRIEKEWKLHVLYNMTLECNSAERGVSLLWPDKLGPGEVGLGGVGGGGVEGGVTRGPT
jgi:hypothetical protein